MVQSTLNGISSLSSINDELPPLYPIESMHSCEIETMEHTIENPSNIGNAGAMEPNKQMFHEVPSEQYINMELSSSSTVASNENGTGLLNMLPSPAGNINFIEDIILNDNNSPNNSEIFDIMDLPILFSGHDDNELNEILANNGNYTKYSTSTISQ